MKRTTFLTKGRNTWFVADFETVTANTSYYREHNDTRVMLFNMLNITEDREYTGVSIEEWWNVLMNFEESTTIFFHNLAFDGDFITKFLFNKSGFKNNWDNSLKNKWFKVFRQGGKIYYIHIYHRKKVNGKVKNINIFIRCSYMLLSTSVEALGKSVDIAKRSEEQKADVNFYDWEPYNTLEDLENAPNGKEYIEYCKRDVLIVVKALKNLEETVLHLPTIKELNDYVEEQNQRKNKKQSKYSVFSSKITAASLSSDLLKKYVSKWIYENKINEGVEKEDRVTNRDYLRISVKDYETITPWYSGGWTQINTDYVGGLKDIKLGCMVDVSSAYPYQMTKPLPYGELLECEPDGVEGVDYYTFYSVYVKHAKIKDKYWNVPILRNWKKFTEEGSDSDERYCRELHGFQCYYLSFEWERICKFYDIEIDENRQYFYYMKAADYLKYFSYEVYAEKDRYGKLGKDGLKQSTKIILNSAYGTLAKRLDFDSFLYIPNDFKLVGDKTILDLEREEKERRSRERQGEQTTSVKFYISEEEEMKCYEFSHISREYDLNTDYSLCVCTDLKEKQSAPNKAAASVITALERCYLWDLIDKVGAKYFGLSDTDSVTFINLTPAKFEFIKTLTGTGLGAWELEFKGNTFKYFATYGAKKYTLLDENKKQLKFKFAGLDNKQAKVHLEDYFLTKEEYSGYNNNVLDFSKQTNTIKNAVLDRVNCYSGIVLVTKDKIYKQTFN